MIFLFGSKMIGSWCASTKIFCTSLKAEIENVFMNVNLPELVTRNADPANEKQNKLYCFCKRPSFEPMIACDSAKCKYE